MNQPERVRQFVDCIAEVVEVVAAINAAATLGAAINVPWPVPENAAARRMHVRLPKVCRTLGNEGSISWYRVNGVVSTPIAIYACICRARWFKSGIDVYADAGLLVRIADNRCMQEPDYWVSRIFVGIRIGKLDRDLGEHVFRNLIIIFNLSNASIIRLNEHVLVTRIRSPSGQGNVNTWTKIPPEHFPAIRDSITIRIAQVDHMIAVAGKRVKGILSTHCRS